MYNFKNSYTLSIISCTISLGACNNPATTIKPTVSSTPVIIDIPSANSTAPPGVNKPVTIDEIKTGQPNIPEILREGPNTIGTRPITPTGSSNPVGQTGGTSDIKERATFNGKIYDPNGIVVDGATVTAKSTDSNTTWIGEPQVSTNGAFVFRNAPVGTRVEITVTKEGWTTRTRTEVLKSNLQGDPTANVFDFGGLGNTGQDQTSSFFAIQDEPEITSLKINGNQASNSGGFPISAGTCTGEAVASPNNGRFGIANLIPCDDDELKASVRSGQLLSVSLTGVENDSLDIELVFSEPVDKEYVRNNFKIISQSFDVRQDKKGFEIDENLSNLSFTWADDDKSVLIKTNKPILTTTTTPEARYLLKWTNPFKDKTNKPALKVGEGNVSPTGHFRYNPGTNNDFNVFSVRIDDQDPRLLSIQALDGGSANDIIRLNFSEPLEVVNQSSPALGLADPADAASQASHQLWAYNTDNNEDGNGDNELETGKDNKNEATVIGYSLSADNVNDFKGVYMIARLPQNIDDETEVKTSSLSGAILKTETGSYTSAQEIDGAKVTCEPARGNPSALVGNASLLRIAKIDGNVVTMEFAPEAFNRNEKIIVSIGENIETSYQDTSMGVSRTEIFVDNNTCTGGSDFNPPYSSTLIDPAGNDISGSNSANSGNIQVNDSLRVATAS